LVPTASTESLLEKASSLGIAAAHWRGKSIMGDFFRGVLGLLGEQP
jgi:hypothetical protein